MAHGIGASRSELLGWLNNLLQLNYTKVEQCGTGAVYCQIVDSVYMNLPMSKVKFNAKQEFEYLHNFKILQQAFKKHKIDKPIPVESLIKCKMQDNLEFLQWLKKFWDVNFTDEAYDPIARRSGAIADGPATVAPIRTSTSRAPAPSAAAPRRVTPSASNIGASNRSAAAPKAAARVGAAPAATLALKEELEETKAAVEGLEKERDFYFGKLRDIEIMIGARLEGEDEVGEQEEALLKDIQAILYAVEEGFEAPEEGEEPEEEEDPEEVF